MLDYFEGPLLKMMKHVVFHNLTVKKI